MTSVRLSGLLLGCLGCSPAQTTDLVASPLAGSVWLIEAIDGKAPASTSDDSRTQLPQLRFGYRSYGGSAGCNALGGLYAQVGARFYTMPGPQTAMACGGARGIQEEAVNAILFASPMVVRGDRGVTLTGGGHRMALRRMGPVAHQDPPIAWQGPTVSGQKYTIHAVNGAPTPGRHLWGKTPPRLTFSSEALTMSLDCARSATGRFTLGSEFILVSDLSASCRTPGARDAALAAILASTPRTVSGPNGELLLAGRAGWAILWNERRDRPK